MQRRKFLKGFGLSLSTAWLGPKGMAGITSNHYPFSLQEIFPPITSLEDLLNEEGMVLLRVSFSSQSPEELNEVSGRIRVKGGEIHKTQAYNFNPSEDSLTANHTFTSMTSLDKSDVMVLWLKDVKDNTQVSIDTRKDSIRFTIQELLAKSQLEWQIEQTKIEVNYLLDKEIGYLDMREVGVNFSGDQFTFAIMADPQGGDPSDESNDSTTRMKVHNAFIEDSVALIKDHGNCLFNLVLGDIVDSKGQWSNYLVLLDFLKRVECPTLWTVGNHETAYNIEFSPGYNMEGFTNFFRAQKAMNGMKEILYAFDLGKWHFVVWPDPLRRNFWETHPHYFDWLEKDLEKNKDRPTIFFHHVPLLPIGIDPLINYVESVDVKRKVLDIITKHGNVKYALSGHVHIPLKASLKTARTYKGIHFINLPAAGYRPRAFGEADLTGGPVQGICLVDVHGDQAKIRYRTVTRQDFNYPESFPEFNESDYPLWLLHKWELPVQKTLINGDFEKDLEYWNKRYRYEEDENPSNRMEVRPDPETDSDKALYLFSKKRGFHIPGQDRMPQTLNQLCQVIALSKGAQPTIKLQLRIDKDNTLLDSFNGVFIWIEGFEKSYKRVNLVYSFNKMFFGIGGQYSELRTVPPQHFDLGSLWSGWAEIQIDVKSDFNKKEEHRWADLNLDRFAINLGTWTVNDGENQSIGAFIKDITISMDSNTQSQSEINGAALLPKKEEALWYGGIKHIAGEHIYTT
ncbi:metallophosphoesterase family protein [Pararhodonellum marinum]|uniref:metallophosphoesterase family protein n=1 Tax=Pararhodonellum marinum TaxID=2755358 RepID=UPI00188DEBA2|nr:metallophosphoesterase [Pararhodonellum marinum]